MKQQGSINLPSELKTLLKHPHLYFGLYSLYDVSHRNIIGNTLGLDSILYYSMRFCFGQKLELFILLSAAKELFSKASYAEFEDNIQSSAKYADEIKYDNEIFKPHSKNNDESTQIAIDKAIPEDLKKLLRILWVLLEAELEKETIHISDTKKAYLRYLCNNLAVNYSALVTEQDYLIKIAYQNLFSVNTGISVLTGMYAAAAAIGLCAMLMVFIHIPPLAIFLGLGLVTFLITKKFYGDKCHESLNFLRDFCSFSLKHKLGTGLSMGLGIFTGMGSSIYFYPFLMIGLAHLLAFTGIPHIGLAIITIILSVAIIAVMCLAMAYAYQALVKALQPDGWITQRWNKLIASWHQAYQEQDIRQYIKVGLTTAVLLIAGSIAAIGVAISLALGWFDRLAVALPVFSHLGHIVAYSSAALIDSGGIFFKMIFNTIITAEENLKLYYATTAVLGFLATTAPVALYSAVSAFSAHPIDQSKAIGKVMLNKLQSTKTYLSDPTRVMINIRDGLNYLSSMLVGLASVIVNIAPSMEAHSVRVLKFVSVVGYTNYQLCKANDANKKAHNSKISKSLVKTKEQEPQQTQTPAASENTSGHNYYAFFSTLGNTVSSAAEKVYRLAPAIALDPSKSCILPI